MSKEMHRTCIWLEEQQKGVGVTDAPGILGVVGGRGCPGREGTWESLKVGGPQWWWLGRSHAEGGGRLGSALS